MASSDIRGGRVACTNGKAGKYPCRNMDLLSLVSAGTFGSALNDLWGWTDPATRREYALVGLYAGTAFVDITEAENPVYVGFLPRHNPNPSNQEVWRDLKTYGTHVYIVSEINGDGLQIFDLAELRNIPLNDPTSLPRTLRETAFYDGFRYAHNIYIHEERARAFVVKANTCGGGLHILNLQNPTAPAEVGCYRNRGPTHDVQCVNYNGPDSVHVGKEICFAANPREGSSRTNNLDIIDTTTPGNPKLLSTVRSGDFAYTHQGWLTEDQRYFILGDEQDETKFRADTATFVVDVSDLDNPRLVGRYDHPSRRAIDHNLYVKGNYVYQANYVDGLVILEMTNLASAALSEVAHFDVFPENNNKWDGAWSNYPFFASGNVIVSGQGQGLFVLRPTLGNSGGGGGGSGGGGGGGGGNDSALCENCVDVATDSNDISQGKKPLCRQTCWQGAEDLEGRFAQWRKIRQNCFTLCNKMLRPVNRLSPREACETTKNMC